MRWERRGFRNERATDDEVFAFIAAVYPEAPHLAMAAFDEAQCLHDATAELARLAARVAELEGEKEKLVARAESTRQHVELAILHLGRLFDCEKCMRQIEHPEELKRIGDDLIAARAEVDNG